MPGIDVSMLSPELAKFVVKDNQVDMTALQNIANSRTMDPKLVEEANKLIAQELTGNKAWGDIGDNFLSTLNSNKKPQKTDEQIREDYIAHLRRQERRDERQKTVVGRWINNRQDDYASVKEQDGLGAKVLEAGKVTLKGMRKGFKVMDKANPLTYLKMPIKEIAAEVDKIIDDGDPEKFSAREKIWNAVKGGGNVLDYLTTTEGIEVTLAMIAAGGIAVEALPAEALARLAPFLNAATTTAGSGIAIKGAVDVAIADTPEEAQKGGAEIFSGGVMVGMSALTAKQSLDAARHAGVAAKDPNTLNTLQAMGENFRVAPEGVKVALGLQAPTMGTAIPASAIRMVSKPNEVEAYVNTGKADGIVYESSDGKLYCPNKWSPTEPYEVKEGSIIMIYDEAGNDFAVCDPKIFQKTYVNDAGQYNAMQGIEPGQRIHATKQAVGGFEVVPEGTMVQTLEGPRTIGKGEVVCYDVDGNPYVSPLSNVLKRNTITNPEQIAEFYKADPMAALKVTENQEAMAQWLKQGGFSSYEYSNGTTTTHSYRSFELNGHEYRVKRVDEPWEKGMPVYDYIENEEGIHRFFREGDAIPEMYQNDKNWCILPKEEFDIIKGIDNNL